VWIGSENCNYRPDWQCAPLRALLQLDNVSRLRWTRSCIALSDNTPSFQKSHPGAQNMIFTKIKGYIGKWPQDILFYGNHRAKVKICLPRRSHFNRHNKYHIGRIWTDPFARMGTCVGICFLSSRKLSKISACCLRFGGLFRLQDTLNARKGHNRSIQTKRRITLICDTTTVPPKLSFF
jgi:hypothetical protein